MPLPESKSLKDDEVYALAAYILAQNKIIGEDDVMDARTLPQVRMPNRDGFVRFERGKYNTRTQAASALVGWATAPLACPRGQIARARLPTRMRIAGRFAHPTVPSWRTGAVRSATAAPATGAAAPP